MRRLEKVPHDRPRVKKNSEDLGEIAQLRRQGAAARIRGIGPKWEALSRHEKERLPPVFHHRPQVAETPSICGEPAGAEQTRTFRIGVPVKWRPSSHEGSDASLAGIPNRTCTILLQGFPVLSPSALT